MTDRKKKTFLKFTPRSELEQKYQVRFWSKELLYIEFVASCKKRNLIIQDVFNQFMRWFIEDSNE